MKKQTLSTLADEYFYGINPLAKRIGEDVGGTKEAYEELWDTLSQEERNQAINETIILPEIALKYASKKLARSQDYPEYYPTLRIQTGLKFIIDDAGSTMQWKDEHSAPFSFMTQSQMNLDCLEPLNNDVKNISSFMSDTSQLISSCDRKNRDDSLEDNFSSPSSQISFYQSENFSDTVFSTEDCSSTIRSSCIDSENSESLLAKLVTKTSLLKKPNSSDDDMETLVVQKNFKMNKNPASEVINQLNISFMNRLKTNDNESTALLDTPSSYSSCQSSTVNQDLDIPKTGFEFLDNW